MSTANIPESPGAAAHFLHWSFSNTHVLFPSLCLRNFATFIAASFLVAALCFVERFLSYLSTKEDWVPSFLAESHLASQASRVLRRRWRWKLALWKSGLYWVATLLRLFYMLCAMSFHVGLLLVIATSLALAQFFIELRKDYEADSGARGSYASVSDSEQPLLLSSVSSTTLASQPNPNHASPRYRPHYKPTKPKSKLNKPDGIFIHPNHSNIARADARALQLGLSGPTERVSAASTLYPFNQYNDDDGNGEEAKSNWSEVGKGRGREAARALLLPNDSRSLQVQNQRMSPFGIGSANSIDSSGSEGSEDDSEDSQM